jgi:kynurenine formamidase
MTTNDNWGRWGSHDERGALNLLTPDVVLAATEVCRTGKVYGLALPIQRKGSPLYASHRGVPQRFTLTDRNDEALFADAGYAPGVGVNEDMLLLASHSITHMDALSHVYADERMYNGHPATSFTTHDGASKCDIRQTGTFAGRGILLDLPRHHGVDWLEPGHAIGADELEACAAAQGTAVRSGDILLVRTGWLDLFARGEGTMTQAGLGADAVRFVDEHDIVAVGADNSGVECLPWDGDVALRVHIELLVRRGVTLLEHLVLSELAADGCHEFLLCVGALPFAGAAGSPINPIAIG